MKVTKKKRRTREPFQVTKEVNGEIRIETYWHFSKKELTEKLKKDIDRNKKFAQRPDSMTYNNPYFLNVKLISVLPFPNAYSVSVDMVKHTIVYNVDAQTIAEARKIAKKENPGRKIQVKQTLQIIDG